MVLGRLFKLHPEFDEILISILYSAFHSHELQGRKSTVYIVLIAERIYEYNHHIMKRLRDFLIARDSALTVQQQEELLMRIRFVHLDAYYRLLPFARAVLDTFPYGGDPGNLCRTLLDSRNSCFKVVSQLMMHCPTAFPWSLCLPSSYGYFCLDYLPITV